MALGELRVRGTLAWEFRRDYALPEGRVHRNGPHASINDPKFRSWWRAAPYPDADQMCAAYEKAMGWPEPMYPQKGVSLLTVMCQAKTRRWPATNPSTSELCMVAG